LASILFHALYGFYHLVSRGNESSQLSVVEQLDVPAQRWTGGIAFAYIAFHTYTMRLLGIDLHAYPEHLLARCRMNCFSRCS